MNSILIFCLRALGLLLIQQLLLNHMPIGNGLCFAFILPLALYTLPFDTERTQLILCGFVLGLITDAFESSYGLYTLSFSILAYAIGLLRNRFYGREEAENKQNGILDNGVVKNLPFLFTCNFIVLLAFYLIENFSASGIGYAVLRALLSSILSTLFMASFQFLFPSKRMNNR
jgi:rod shape-determining protein MreD